MAGQEGVAGSPGATDVLGPAVPWALDGRSGTHRPPRYRPSNWGRRFSRKALRPSWKSRVLKWMKGSSSSSGEWPVKLGSSSTVRSIRLWALWERGGQAGHPAGEVVGVLLDLLCRYDPVHQAQPQRLVGAKDPGG